MLFFSSGIRHTCFALVTGYQTWALPICAFRELLCGLSLSRSNMMPSAVDDNLATHFLAINGDAFDTPTFEETVERAAGEGRSRAAFRLPAHAILASGAPDAAPQGVIVHVGRCGSTLLCNLLASGSEDRKSTRLNSSH